LQLGRQVALKLLPLHMTSDAEHLRRFRQEAQAVLALNNPNILTIYDFMLSTSTAAGHDEAVKITKRRGSASKRRPSILT
jgi:hypothetical protein